MRSAFQLASRKCAQVQASISCLSSDWAPITLVLAFAILSRLLFLRNHQINHDESIYVLDSLKYLKEGYQFNPDQHGPFLFFLNMIIFRLFGASDSTILLGPATLGVILVGLPLLLTRVRGVDRRGAILASALLAASPSFLYFSRMMKNDIYLATLLLAVVAFGIRYAVQRSQWDLYLAAVSLGLLFATRVDALFHTLVFLSFPAIYSLMVRHERPIEARQNERPHLAQTLLAAVAIFFLILLFFYSVLPRSTTGLWGNSVALFWFWWERHHLNLLPGPASYYFSLMLEYELPILVIFLMGLKRQLETGQASKFVFRSALLLFAVLFFFGSMPLPFFGRYLHAGTLGEVSFLLYWAFLGGWGTFAFLRQKKVLYAFLLFWAATSNLFYAYAGEKQPQIVLFPLLPMIVLTGFLLSEYLQATNFERFKPVYVVMCGVAFTFYLYVSLIVSFVTYYYPSERLSNATTSPEVGQLRELLVRTSQQTGLGKALPIKFMFTFSSDVLAWYLRDFPNKRYSHQLEQFYPVIIFYNHKRYEYRPLLEKQYEHVTIHTNLGSGYHRQFQSWPAGTLIQSLYREAQFQILRWRFRPVGGAYIDVYIQRPRAAFSPKEQGRVKQLDKVFTRRAVPVVGQFGHRGSLPGELHGASDMAIDQQMNLYVADTLNRRVTKYAQDGTPLLWITDDAHPFAPEGLGLCEETGSLYVAIPPGNEVRQYTLDGHYLRSIRHAFMRPMDVACDGDGDVFVIDHSPQKVLKFDGGGRPVADWTVPGSLFQSPASIKVDKVSGEILIVDLALKKLVKLDPSGGYLVSFDLPGISEAQHQLYFDLDGAGHLLIPDLSNSRILILDRRGKPLMVIGEESRGYGGVLGPVSVAQRQKRIYVYSQYLERITGYDLERLPFSYQTINRK